MHPDLLQKSPALYEAGTKLVWAQKHNKPKADIQILLNRLECLLHEYYELLKQEGLLNSDHVLEFNFRGWLQVAYSQRVQWQQEEQLEYLNSAKPPPRNRYH